MTATFPEIGPLDEPSLMRGDWLDEAKGRLEESGAVLLRTSVFRPDAAEIALGMVDSELLDDAFWSTPRSKIAGKTLTATEYPSPRTIPLHSEMAYMPVWPRFVAFHSIEVASEGGETTICDIDKVSDRLGDTLLPFRDKGILYRRTFQKRVDITWQKAFQSEDREDVEEVGRRLGMKIEWFANDVLVTSHTAQGTIAAEDGRPIFFNQAHVFHPSSLPADARGALEKMLGADRLPRQSMYGDGSPIAEADLAKVRDSFDSFCTNQAWQPGDILMLDNMRFAHGRRPFAGSRKLHVAMARSCSEPVRTPLFA